RQPGPGSHRLPVGASPSRVGSPPTAPVGTSSTRSRRAAARQRRLATVRKAQRPDVGAVGPKLKLETVSVQSASNEIAELKQSKKSAKPNDVGTPARRASRGAS